MTQSNVLLKMEHISKSFPSVIALDDVQFTLNKGEIHALLGENGAGKSTLIKVLTGVYKKDCGNIYLQAQTIEPSSPHMAQKLGIATVYQEVNLCPHLSVAENIFIGRESLKHGRIDWKTIRKKAKEILLSFDINIDVSTQLGDFSVAIQQMVAIARAVDQNAKILVLDEPTSSLSVSEVDKLFTIMRMLKQKGMGIIFVTHFLGQVYEVCDAISVLRNGKYVGSYIAKNLPRLELVSKMIGREYKELEDINTVQKLEQNTGNLLKIENASSKNIENISLSIKNKEVLGFAGLLGSGRSETVRLLFQADKMLSGNMQMDNQGISIKNPLQAIRSGFAFCPEDRKKEGIFGELSIRENIIIALQTKRGMLKAINLKESQALADKFIDEIKIKTPSASQQIKNLSGGNQQKVILARWLACQPKLLMLDEPTRGIDIAAKAEIQKIIVELAQNQMSCIFVSSEIEEMIRCCKRILVLRDKQIVGELLQGDISENKIMEHIAGGAKSEKL